MGAIGAALGAARPTCLTVGSVKSVYGHTEGAAGLTGILMAAAALQNAAAAPVANLGALNPYVASALEGWTKAGSSSAAAVPRQHAPAVDLLPAHVAAGAGAPPNLISPPVYGRARLCHCICNGDCWRRFARTAVSCTGVLLQ